MVERENSTSKINVPRGELVWPALLLRRAEQIDHHWQRTDVSLSCECSGEAPLHSQSRDWLYTLSQPPVLRLEDIQTMRDFVSASLPFRTGGGWHEGKPGELARAIGNHVLAGNVSLMAVEALVRGIVAFSLAHPESPIPVHSDKEVGRRDTSLSENLALTFGELASFFEESTFRETCRRASRLLSCDLYQGGWKELAKVVAFAAQDSVVRRGVDNFDDAMADEIAFRVVITHRLWYNVAGGAAIDLFRFWQSDLGETLRDPNESDCERRAREKLADKVAPRVLLELVAQDVIGEDWRGEELYQELGVGDWWAGHREILEEREKQEYLPQEGRGVLVLSTSVSPPHLIHFINMGVGAALTLNGHTFMVLNENPPKTGLASFEIRQTMALYSRAGLEGLVSIWPRGLRGDTPTKLRQFVKEFRGKFGFTPKITLLRGTDASKIDPRTFKYRVPDAPELAGFVHAWLLRPPFLADNIYATLANAERLLQSDAFAPGTIVMIPALRGVSSTRIRERVREGQDPGDVHPKIVGLVKETYTEI